MAQETRRRQNEFLASHKKTVPPAGTELDPIPAVNYEMPPLDEDMFHGIEDFGVYMEPPPADDDDEAGDDDEEGSRDDDDARDSDGDRVPSDDF